MSADDVLFALVVASAAAIGLFLIMLCALTDCLGLCAPHPFTTSAARPRGVSGPGGGTGLPTPRLAAGRSPARGLAGGQ